MIEDEFVPYALAIGLKEIGFNEGCMTYYDEDGYFVEFTDGKDAWTNNDVQDAGYVTSPTYGQAFKFLRDTYKFKHEIPDHCGEKFYFDIKDMTHTLSVYQIKQFCTKDKDWSVVEFDSYEKAETHCLNMMIEVIKEFKVVKHGSNSN